MLSANNAINLSSRLCKHTHTHTHRLIHTSRQQILT